MNLEQHTSSLVVLPFGGESLTPPRAPSRFWYERSYAERFAAGQDPESFDKEYVRRWLAERGFRGDGPIPTIPDEVKIEAMLRYIEAVEQITGEPFVPNLEEPQARLKRNLAALYAT